MIRFEGVSRRFAGAERPPSTGSTSTSPPGRPASSSVPPAAASLRRCAWSTVWWSRMPDVSSSTDATWRRSIRCGCAVVSVTCCRASVCSRTGMSPRTSPLCPASWVGHAPGSQIGWTRCSTSSASIRTRIASDGPTNCQAASASASASPAPWRRTLTCSSWTNPSAPWTPSPATGFRKRSARSCAGSRRP